MAVVEGWADIPGFEALYQASSEGRIRSLDRIVLRRLASGHVHEKRLAGRVLKSARTGSGYQHLTLCREGEHHQFDVHRLVAMAFHGTPAGYEKMDVNHRDGNKANNRADNLEWCNRSQNMAHARALGLHTLDKPVFGRPIRGGADVFFSSGKAAAEALGLHPRMVNSAARGERITAGGYRWRYSENDWTPLPDGYAPRSPRSPTFKPLAA